MKKIFKNEVPIEVREYDGKLHYFAFTTINVICLISTYFQNHYPICKTYSNSITVLAICFTEECIKTVSPQYKMVTKIQP